jgi:adenosylhomocysteinase
LRNFERSNSLHADLSLLRNQCFPPAWAMRETDRSPWEVTDLLDAVEIPKLEEDSQAGLAHVRLPTLEHHVAEYPCSASRLVLITHVLDTAVPFVAALRRGIDLARVLAIPYSVVPDARERVSEHAPVIVPADVGQLQERAREEIRDLCSDSEERVIVQEIGGYCAPLIHDLSQMPSFGGVVEDTKQGHWAYLQQPSLPCPVLTIADSPLKALEDRQVGRAISHALDTILRREFYRLLAEARIGVLGYGGIGEATAASLSAAGAQVAVFDVCDIGMARAAMAGFAAGAREDLLRTSDIIVGVSGHRSVSSADLPLLKDGVVLVSGSSKQVEFDVTALSSHGTLVLDAAPVKQYEINGKALFLLNDGMPINFLEQSVLGRVLDLVYTELYMCVRELSLGAAKPGLSRLTMKQQREIAEIWRACHWSDDPCLP